MEIPNDINNILKIGIKAISDKKAENIKIINISQISSIADIMVISSGNNINHIHAMADELEEKLNKAGYNHLCLEGYDRANWILLDYNAVIFHLFDNESRSFYDLERLYRDGEIIESSNYE